MIGGTARLAQQGRHPGGRVRCAAIPVHHRPVVRIESRSVFPRLLDLRLQLVFINRDSQARIGQQRTVAVRDGGQVLGEQVLVIRVATLLDQFLIGDAEGSRARRYSENDF